jgi:hypothetical protein
MVCVSRFDVHHDLADRTLVPRCIQVSQLTSSRPERWAARRIW